MFVPGAAGVQRVTEVSEYEGKCGLNSAGLWRPFAGLFTFILCKLLSIVVILSYLNFQRILLLPVFRIDWEGRCKFDIGRLFRWLFNSGKIILTDCEVVVKAVWSGWIVDSFEDKVHSFLGQRSGAGERGKCVMTSRFRDWASEGRVAINWDGFEQSSFKRKIRDSVPDMSLKCFLDIQMELPFCPVKLDVWVSGSTSNLGYTYKFRIHGHLSVI